MFKLHYLNMFGPKLPNSTNLHPPIFVGCDRERKFYNLVEKLSGKKRVFFNIAIFTHSWGNRISAFETTSDRIMSIYSVSRNYS